MTVSAATAQQIVLAEAPGGIVQAVGGPAEKDSFVLGNAGANRISVTLVPSASFFTVSPTPFTLSPGANAKVTIQPNTTTPGFYGGWINVFVTGITNPLRVPVRMFIGTRPVGTTSPVSSNDLLVISGPPGTDHAGSWNVANSGDATMQGMLVSDVTWIVPQGDMVKIGPHRSAPFPFITDSGRRDSIAPVGALFANLQMDYLKGTVPATSDPSGSIAVGVLDINKLPVTPAEPPPVASGERVSFLPVVTDTAGYFTDLFFANRSASALTSDLKLYYTQAGSAPPLSLMANAGQLARGVAAWFPLAPSSLFNVANETGTVQVRTGEPRRVAVSMIRGIIPDGVNRYLTAMPVLRSDRAIASGDRIFFSGVEKSANAHTDVVVQETAGSAGSFTIDFFDAIGAPVPPGQNGTLLPFGSAILSDVVPAGARSARVTNTSGGDSRLTGFASVVDETTLDMWAIVDSTRGPEPTADLVLPVPEGASSSTFDAWVTNTSNAPAIVTLAPTPVSARRRAVRRGSADNAAELSFILGAGETRQVPLNDVALGFVHISGPTGAISAAGRLVSTAPKRLGSFGTGVPAIPSAFASGLNGPVRHFQRANDVPNVASPALLLVETSGRPATVRVTVAFSFPAGWTVSGHFEDTRDYDVPAGQLVTISDVIRSVVGPARDSFGTLANVVVDVEVVAGDGRVLPYLQTIDASGDLTLSVD